MQVIIILAPGTRIIAWRDLRVLVKKSLIDSYRRKEFAEHVTVLLLFLDRGGIFFLLTGKRERGWSQQGEVEGLVEMYS